MKPPIAAAPKALMINSVSVVASICGNSGASSTPDSAARVDPIIQARRRIRTGLVAARSSRAGSSTTARMASPALARFRYTCSPAVSRTATPKIMILAYETKVPPILTPPAGRYCGTTRVVLVP